MSKWESRFYKIGKREIEFMIYPIWNGWFQCIQFGIRWFRYKKDGETSFNISLGLVEIEAHIIKEIK